MLNDRTLSSAPSTQLWAPSSRTGFALVGGLLSNRMSVSNSLSDTSAPSSLRMELSTAWGLFPVFRGQIFKTGERHSAILFTGNFRAHAIYIAPPPEFCKKHPLWPQSSRARLSPAADVAWFPFSTTGGSMTHITHPLVTERCRLVLPSLLFTAEPVFSLRHRHLHNVVRHVSLAYPEETFVTYGSSSRDARGLERAAHLRSVPNPKKFDLVLDATPIGRQRSDVVRCLSPGVAVDAACHSCFLF